MQTLGSEIRTYPERFFPVPESFVPKMLASSNPSIHSFKGQEHASLYRKFRFAPSPDIPKMVFNYLKEKKEAPFALVADVGCGSGQSTRGLAPYFQKVVGVDVSEAQISEAKQNTLDANISYSISSADQLPFDDSSVDLVTSTTAVHWFNLEKFLKEADRILKPNGCLALHTLSGYIPLFYKDRSESISAVFKEAMEFLFNYSHECFFHIRDKYQKIFELVPYTEKKRVDTISETFPMTVTELMGFLESLYMYQTYKALDPEAAKEFLPKTQKRILETLGVTSMDTKVDFVAEYYCVVARKPA
ncbi:putative methyltransferase DDB_G0268948 [Ambystoma mexicanum]|uniref:putative methyltransferase DDB_G0268948 n=1 Tax=Ambystoma mexicanum TaxID=8296 RepID=UPI0037E8C0B3